MERRAALKQVNLVVRDMKASRDFYERLGVDVATTNTVWDEHHCNASAVEGFDFDLDSAEFATKWDAGWPEGKAGAVITFAIESRAAVDEIYDDLTSAGYEGEQPPVDAFWGARFAIVKDPDGTSVGLMSPSDDAHRSAGPTPGQW
jgi:catechol 2,3-dioxygenase-like lactoylglutathione lyase family enzyme